MKKLLIAVVAMFFLVPGLAMAQFHGPSHNGGHNNPGHGGYNPPSNNGGHNSPGHGGYNPPSNNGGHNNPGHGGYNPPSNNGGHNNPGHGGHGGYNPPPPPPPSHGHHEPSWQAKESNRRIQFFFREAESIFTPYMGHHEAMRYAQTLGNLSRELDVLGRELGPRYRDDVRRIRESVERARFTLMTEHNAHQARGLVQRAQYDYGYLANRIFGAFYRS